MPRLKQPSRGFTIGEIVITLAVVVVIATIGLITADRVIEGSRSSKLIADVETINSAARVFLSQGGDLDIGPSTDPNLVIAHLRAKLSDEEAETFVGLKGGMVDPRLRAVLLSPEEEASSMSRAVWLPGEARFRIATSGRGVKEFVLDATPITAEHSRKSVLRFAETSNWVWDYADRSRGPKSAFDEPTLSPTETASVPPSPASQSALMPPSMSIPGGTYDFAHYPLSVALTDPNPSGVSRILYQLNGGIWNVYSGTSLVIAPNALSTLVAYCESSSPDRWLDSVATSESYSTFTFSGKTAGEFDGATGASTMVIAYETTAEKSEFFWGDPAVAEGFLHPSELTFTGAEFSTIILEQEFVLGTLDYYNGSIWAGTGADTVDLEVALDLAEEGAMQATNIAFELELVNTPNDYVHNTADQNADYVRLRVPVQEMTTMIDGKTYYVHLSFGESGPQSFTTDSTFHVWEGAEARGTILAKFSATPPGGEDVTRPSVVVSSRSTLVDGHFNVDITFNEYVTGLGASDFSVSNGSVSAVTGDGYQFVLGVAPATDGAVTVSLPENVAFDLAGNGNTVSNSVTVSADKTPPTVSLVAAPAANGDFVVDAKFSEPVVGMSAFDWETKNGIVNSVIGSGAEYKATVIPADPGIVSVGLKAGAVTDLVGHSLLETAEINVQYDPVPPQAILSMGTSDVAPVVSGMFSVDLELTDGVSDLAPTDFVVTNGLAFTIVESDPSHYAISVVPQNPGDVSLFLAGGSVHDLAGNGNMESNTITASYIPPNVASGYIDFNAYTISSWGATLILQQDSGTANINGGGKELRLSGNAWKSIDFSYHVTSRTVLEFEFKANKEGLVHGIGFDDNQFLNLQRVLQLYGQLEEGIQDFHDYSAPSWRTYSIPVGHYYTGEFDRMFFTAGQDLTGVLDAESRFRNVRVYEQ
ncbi:MAG: choice-of-anchor K domain-containing protein [Verrucomicrobiae bacterium]|nr:choice-of-anchor K domain-containing protein [Verrucomicrobiae bacterium]